MDFSGLDIAVGVILILSAIIAFARGFVTEVLSLAAWGGAILVTMLGFGPLAGWVQTWIVYDWLAKAASIAFLFFFSLMLLRIITNKIGSMVKSSSLGVADRALGGAFGVLRGFVMIAFAFLIYTLLIQPDDPPGWIVDAKTGPSIMDGADLLAKAIYGGDGGESPSDVLNRLKDRAKDITIENAIKNTGYGEDDRKSLDSLAEDVSTD